MFVDFQRLTDIVVNKSKIRMIQNILNIRKAPSVIIVYADNPLSFTNQPMAQVSAQKAGSARNKYCLHDFLLNFVPYSSGCICTVLVCAFFLLPVCSTCFAGNSYNGCKKQNGQQPVIAYSKIVLHLLMETIKLSPLKLTFANIRPNFLNSSVLKNIFLKFIVINITAP